MEPKQTKTNKRELAGMESFTRETKLTNKNTNINKVKVLSLDFFVKSEIEI